MKPRILLLCAGVILATGAGQVFAHHSFSATYDSQKRVELEGVVKEMLWRNPHSFLKIDVAAEDGTTKTWNLEWGSISQLSKLEVTRTTLRPGDKIKIAGEPARDASSARILLQYLERPVDGFTWQGKVD